MSVIGLVCCTWCSCFGRSSERIRGTVQSIYSALSCIRSLIAHCGGIGSVWYGLGWVRMSLEGCQGIY